MPAKGRGKPADRTEATEIVLRIASDNTREFEAMFEAEEIPIWEDFTRRGRFLECRLVRVQGGSESRPGIQDYRSEEHQSELQSPTRRSSDLVPGKGRGKPADRTEATEIVLRIASDNTREFEAMFEAEEIPIWEDFTRRGRFLECRLVRVQGGSESRPGIQDY